MATRVVPTLHGPMIVEERDKYLCRSLIELGEFSMAQVEFFAGFLTKEMVVVDAGANIGALTVPLARMAGLVHAFEPQRHIFHMLCGNVALNSLDNVRCYNLGLGERDEVVDVVVLDPSIENNLGAFNLDAPGTKLDRVRVVPLDIPCNLLKIDVEGYETHVLRGAEPMIRECEPMIYVENDRIEKSDALIEQVYALGYTPFWHITPLYRPNNHHGNAINPFGAAASFDMICTKGGEGVTGMQAKPGDLHRFLGERHAA